ncbi:MAG: ATP-binding protein [Pyrinomonadaceae bacterium]
MRSLFLKVFLWFWLAMALVVGALFVTTELTRTRQPFPFYTGMDRIMDVYARQAADTYERTGRAGLAQLFGAANNRADITFFFFDEQGTEVMGRSVPPEVQAAARRAITTRQIVRAPPGEGMFGAHPVVTDGGHLYVVADLSQHSHFSPFFEHPAAHALPILAVLLTVGALCYGLARYIVSPVVKLRGVTRQVAGGDLSARVGPLLGKRRDELAAMGHDFDTMATRVETLVSVQQRLIRDISHELRSPLARLNVALDLARKRAGVEATSALDRIEREAWRLNEMIGQLLTLARWESGMDERRRTPVDLAQLVEEVVADANFEAGHTDRAVRVTRCDSCYVAGVAPLLRSAIENVVRNAVHYTPAHTLVDVALHCQVAGDASVAVISVRDHGAGVPNEALADIFRPFYRVADARDRASGGTGLGLAITERAVRLHEGSVTAANHPDGGLLVELHLPAVAAAKEQPVAQTAAIV